MKNYLLVNKSTNLIEGHSTSCVVETGFRCVVVEDQSISGDALPDDKGDMMGGTLTKAFVYTKPADYVANPKITALKNLDASQETGALKTVIEYLQR